MTTVAYALRESILVYAQRSADAGLVPSTQGNVSARDPETGLIAITPHDMPYGTMTPDDLVLVDVDGNKVAGDLDISYETPVHCAVYRARSDVHAIVHTEPIYTNVLGSLGIAIQPVVVSLLANLGGAVPIMPYMPSGSDAFGRAAVEVMGDGYAVVWANHGLMTVGRSVDEAFRRTLLVEHAAQIYYLALLRGQPVVVTHEMFKGAQA